MTDQDTKVKSEYPAETKRGGIFMVEEIISTSFHTYIYIYVYMYMRVVLNSFIWKTSSSPKKLLSPNFRELHVFLSRYMLAKIFKKNVDV